MAVQFISPFSFLPTPFFHFHPLCSQLLTILSSLLWRVYFYTFFTARGKKKLNNKEKYIPLLTAPTKVQRSGRKRYVSVGRRDVLITSSCFAFISFFPNPSAPIMLLSLNLHSYDHHQHPSFNILLSLLFLGHHRHHQGSSITSLSFSCAIRGEGVGRWPRWGSGGGGKYLVMEGALSGCVEDLVRGSSRGK